MVVVLLVTWYVHIIYHNHNANRNFSIEILLLDTAGKKTTQNTHTHTQ